MRPVVDGFGLPGLVSVKMAYPGYLWFVTRHKSPDKREQERFAAFLLGAVAVVNNTAEIAHGDGLSLLIPWRGNLRGSTPGVTRI